MPRGKSAIGTYFSARKGESSHRKSLTLQRFSIQIFWDRREQVPVGRSHPEQSANATRLSQGDYMFLKKRTPPKKWVDDSFLLGQAVSWFFPGWQGEKAAIVSARFRTEDLSRVRRAWWPLHYGNSHCSPVLRYSILAEVDHERFHIYII